MRKLLVHLPKIALLLLVTGVVFVPSSAHAADVAGAVLDYFGFGFDALYGLIGKIIWWTLVPVTTFVLNLIGQLIDIALAFSLNSEFYGSEGVTLGWGIIRDLCNIIFIFVLVFTGVRTILGLDTGETRRVVISVIIGAVLINFSLFLTKAAIDVSNIFTAWITNGIKVLGGGYGVSDSAISVLKMSKLAESQGSITNITNWNLTTFGTGIALVVLNCISIYVFFKVAFLMLGRLVSFILLLIMSPIGFVGHLVPKLDAYAKQWRDELTKACLMAPMFLLLLYITLFLATKFDGVLAKVSASAGSTNALLGANFGIEQYALFAIISMMMLKSLAVAEEYTGEVAGQVGGMIKSAAGVALGGVTAGGGALLRQTAGRYALARTADKEAMGALQGRAANGGLGGVMARMQLAATNKAATSSFDARATKLGGAALGALDPKLNIAGIKLDASKVGKTESGGFKAQMEEIAKTEQEYAEKNLGKGKAGEANRIKYANTVSNSAWYIGRRAGAKKAGEEISGAAYKAYGKAELEGAQGDAQKIKNQMIDEQVAISKLESASKTNSVYDVDNALMAEKDRVEATRKKMREDKDTKLAYNRVDRKNLGEKIHAPDVSPEEADKMAKEIARLDTEYQTATAGMTDAEKKKTVDDKMESIKSFNTFVDNHLERVGAATKTTDITEKKKVVENINKKIKDERIGKPGEWNKDSKKFEGGSGLSEQLREKKKDIQDKKREQDILDGKTPKGKDKNTPPPPDEEPEDEAGEDKK